MPASPIGAFEHTTHPHLIRFYARNAVLGDSPRSRKLDYYESFYRCVEYEDRSHDFNGRTLDSRGESRGVRGPVGLPPGYQDWSERSEDAVPFAKRRPTAPSRLARSVVNRFTGMLFSSKKRPTVRVLGDADTEDWFEGLVEAGDLWQVMTEARNLGGATGTCVISFGFRDGHPCFEVHNPKHCVPTWKDRGRLDVAALDITYKYPVEKRTRKGWRTFWYWYRRRIDHGFDVTYQPIEVAPGVLPGSKEHPWVPKRWARHGFGEAPVIWVQNTRNSAAIDGDPDCEGQFESIQEHDQERSLAGEGIKPNCDPTVHVATNKKANEIKKGSRNAIVTELGGAASYVEMSGSGTTAARENADALKSQILEAVSCVIEGEGASATTATEIRHRYRAMFDQVDVLRTQYGKGLKRLLEKVERAARALGEKQPGESGPAPSPEGGRPGKLTIDKDGRPPSTDLPEGEERDEDEGGAPRPVVYSIELPPKVIASDNSEIPDAVMPRKLGDGGGVIQIVWPEHVTPTPAEVETMIRALTSAEAAGYIDGETAAKLLAGHLGIQDAAAVYRKAQLGKAEREAQLALQLAAQWDAQQQGAGGGRIGNREDQDDPGRNPDDPENPNPPSRLPGGNG